MRPKAGHARNRSRTACFNERFLKQAILSSKQLAQELVDRTYGSAEHHGASFVYAGDECATCDPTPGSHAMVDWCISAVQQGRVNAWVANVAALEEGWSRSGCASDVAISPDLSYGTEILSLELSGSWRSESDVQVMLERLDKALLQAEWMGTTKTLLNKWLKGSCSPSIKQGDQIRFKDMRGLFIIAGGDISCAH